MGGGIGMATLALDRTVAGGISGSGTVASKTGIAAFAGKLLKAGTIIPSDPVRRVFFHLSDRREKTLLVLAPKEGIDPKAQRIIGGFEWSGKRAGKESVFYASPDEAGKFSGMDCVLVMYDDAMAMRVNLKGIVAEGGLLFVMSETPMLFSKSGNEIVSLRCAGKGV
ncbi:MAG: hypothetical protein WCT52_02405 [Candidatus Micrarchaeia archaeon]